MSRPKKPVALAIRDGDRPSRINADAPTAPEGLGEPPAWLEGHALEGWATLAAELGPLRVATVADRQLAMVFCEAYGDYRAAKEAIARDGMMIEQVSESSSLSGGCRSTTTRKAHPLLPTLRESRSQMMKALAAFGMSPTSRASLRLPAAPDDDDMLAFAREGHLGGR